MKAISIVADPATVTVAQAVEARERLQDEVLDLVVKFERETGMVVSGIDVARVETRDLVPRAGQHLRRSHLVRVEVTAVMP